MVPPSSDRITRVPPYSRIGWKLRVRGSHPLRPAFPGRSASRQPTTGLLRFRSPLLAESLLMSSPPGTEMFQFPGFAPPAYGFSQRYPSRGGLPHSETHGSTPARGSPWLFAACHVLRRLLVPRHPPSALLARGNAEPAPGSPQGPGRHPAQEPPPARPESGPQGAPARTTQHTHGVSDPGRPREAPPAAHAARQAPGQTSGRQTQKRTKP